jgi:hypothetical protein
MGWSAFAPKGPTVTYAATTSAGTGAQAPGSAGEPQTNNYLVSNATAQACMLGYGINAAQAQAMATALTGVYLGPSSTQSFTFGNATFFSVIALATTSTVYITPGDGL